MIQMHLMYDDDQYYISVNIDDEEIDLTVKPDGASAGAYMAKWVRDRGCCFASDSARRLSEAQRTESRLLTLDVWTKADKEAHDANVQALIEHSKQLEADDERLLRNS